ncbi:cytochrome P450 [Trametes elegans]|nr:cytochrome P450 [Trametes elegans]
MPSLQSLIFPATGLIFWAYLYHWVKALQRRRTRPPGPPGVVLLGNLFDVPRERPWEKLAEWAEQYGDLIYLQVPRKTILILNSLEAVVDLEEKRAQLYSDRPYRIMSELSQFDVVTTFRVRYDDALKAEKKYLHVGFNRSAVQRHAASQERAAHTLCRRLRESPDDFLEHMKEVTISSIRDIVYGVDSELDGSSEHNKVSMEVLNQFTKMASPRKYLVDVIPFLRYLPSWFPGTAFHKEATSNQQLIHHFMNDPFVAFKNRLAVGKAQPCFLENILTAQTLSTQEEETIKHAAGSAFGGTPQLLHSRTVALLSAFVMAMVLNQDVQARAQAEIDSVLGRGAIPTFADRTSLPFVGCVVTEVFRWRPPVLFAWRCLRADDHYRGYTIPAGTIVCVNARGLTHNSTWYPDPDAFKPERFLDTGGKHSTRTVPDPRRFIFGFGRRSCPGLYVADNFLYITIATMLASFTISPALGADGKPILPDPNYSAELGGIWYVHWDMASCRVYAVDADGHPSQPPPFPCSITPRGRAAPN